MLEISELKEKKLPELQEIAKELKIPRFSSLKKLDLIYQILDVQAAKPSEDQKGAPTTADNTKTNHSVKPVQNSQK
jgi:transcription termination factor Rho